MARNGTNSRSAPTIGRLIQGTFAESGRRTNQNTRNTMSDTTTVHFPISKINEAFDKLKEGSLRYRAILDIT